MTINEPGYTSQGSPTESAETKKKQQKINPWMIVLGAIFLAGMAVFVIYIFSSEPPQPPLEVDDSWQRVQAAGVLRVATSADYPPFSYYNDAFMLDGFDPTLIEEIGAKLGVDVEITDYAFEGLVPVLRVGQADVIIAALSVSLERESLIDFSNIYYVGQDAILTQTYSGIGPITNPGQMTGLRIGVQKKSIYHEWAQRYLVDTGVIPQDKLFAYAKPEHAVNDLKLDRLDLVIMDLQPATAALTLGDLELVGQGLNQQRLAIAIPPGANSLKAEINHALLTLQNEGRVSQLAAIYLDIKPENIIPPPTPLPTPGYCTDVMDFVKYLNYDHEDLTNIPKFDPGESFQKGIRIRNSGSCTWTSAYFIRYAHGNHPAAQTQGQPTSSIGEVKPGESSDIYINLIAPEIAGTFIGYWQMVNDINKPFGQTISIAAQVLTTEPGEPTATVIPTSSATPTLEPRPTTTITPISTETELPPEPTATEVPPESTPTEEPDSELLNSSWILAEYLADPDEEDLTEHTLNADVNLRFTEGDSFNGISGCNSYNGRYVTNGEQIIFKGFSISQAICQQPEGIMDWEILYLDLLESTEEYRFNDDDQIELIRYILNENNEREEKILLVFDGLRAETQ